MDLSTTYLGLKLAHPFVPGASPLADEVAVARRLEDAGAPALVMRSLFEEQIAREQLGAFLHAHRHGESFAIPRPTSGRTTCSCCTAGDRATIGEDAE